MRPLRYATRTAILLPLLLAVAAGAGLQQDIERTIAEAGFTNREVSVAVRECGTDRLIAAVSASTPRMPASNQKLLTAGVAAMVLGADFSFQTRLVRRGDDLIVIGDGDPALGDDLLLKKMTLPDGTTLTATGLLDLWAASVVNSGTRHVQTLIVDDRIFDRDWYPEEWPKDQLQRHYCAAVGGINFNHNTVKLRPVPRGKGVDVSDMRPAYPNVVLDNQLKRGHGKDTSVIDPHRSEGSNEITLLGTVPVATQKPVEVTIDNPPLQFGQLLAARLRLVGVAVDAVRLADASDQPPSGVDVAPPITTSIETVLERCNHDSDNMFAEALLKRIAHAVTGRQGTRADGSRIVTATVERLTGSTDGLRVADGSGMSRLNSISARTLTAWLCRFDDSDPNQNLFIESLAEKHEGTLKDRLASVDLHGATLRAKTGYIARVYAISGYVECPDGRRLAFSVLINTSKKRLTWKLRRGIVATIINQGC